ncbi:cytochrome P450 [Pseudoclavibacter chungangensis]|uniref:Cytochrome P450 n=1 Tax=Pseudoclavibacter chungangensis TaxID=587635 RepID=A0A7J5BMP9_9MICO|nr:cytochrome P450 [Pseudoclavibacter chungangensis]KAB1652854.1 cytochrome P450 [Pseudoclavibacter chungangensis]NYJ67150.1 cytochrome P450 [Pseudoclavibacter chungangensis]
MAEVAAGKDPWASASSQKPLRRTLGDPVITLVGGEMHDDLRAGVDKKLQPRPISKLIEASVRPIARGHAIELAARGEADLVGEYFEPVSVEALRHVMGLDPYVDSATLVRWFKMLAQGGANVMNDPAIYEISDQAAREIEEVLLPVLDELAKKPDDSMLSHMLWANREGGEPRDRNHILSTVKILLLGGMQEPGHAASSSALGLFESDQWGLLREDQSKWIPQAVLEGLRWIAPIGTTGRQPARDIEFRGVSIPKDHLVETVLASANRDESHFERPDVFDIERNEKAHQAFGGGQHFCAGHFFGRQVERIMFEELLAATKDITLKDGADIPVTGWVFRAPRSIEVSLQAV